MRYVLCALLPVLAVACSANAGYSYDFRGITVGSPYISDPRLDIEMDVSYEDSTGFVVFKFENESTFNCILSEIYFDDGVLFGISAIDNGPSTQNVQFTQGANPPDLPGGQTLTPRFEVSTYGNSNHAFSVDSQNTAQGLNPGEYVAIKFALLPDATFNDVIDNLNSASALRVGIHVRGVDNTANSIALVNIPEPATMTLLALGGILLSRRK